MKKILILGGGRNQLPLIRTAKDLGYYVVLCDFRDDVEGVKYADVHYQVNTLNCDEVQSVCEAERPDGIISNSEPAMPIVARISRHFGMVGNNEQSIDTLMSKNRFRSLQKTVGVFTPDYNEITSPTQALEVAARMKYPIIIKPAQCSGSRGSRRIDKYDEQYVKEVFEDCLHYSTNGKVVVEQFVEMPSLTTVEGDVFIHKGHFLFEGLFSTTRASWAPMVPMTYTAPAVLDDCQRQKVIDACEKVFSQAGIQHGEYNIEGYFSSENDFFIIEINVRQGGHEIPLLIKDFTGIDYTRLLVSTAVGDDSYWNEVLSKPAATRYIIKQTTFSQHDGIYEGLYIDDSIARNIIRRVEYKNKGDAVNACVDGTSICAIVDMEFANRESQLAVYDKMNELIKVKTIKSN